jgi:two-component sensor histidine kinase
MSPDDVLTARAAELEADNARLRRLLDRGDAPAELRHRLSATLGILREVMRRSAEARPEAVAYAEQLEDRLNALMRVHAAIDRCGVVDLHTAFVDELMTYAVQEGERLRLSGPEVSLQPRAAQSLGVAIHELAVNAVEHGAVDAPGGRIDVSWVIEPGDPDPWLVLAWKETGLVDLAEPARCGFGTEALREMVRHDLGACVTLAYEPDGLRWTARIPFPTRVGSITETD